MNSRKLLIMALGNLALVALLIPAVVLANGDRAAGRASSNLPLLAVANQPLLQGTVTVEHVASTGPGWVVVHRSDGGQMGRIIGLAALQPGVNVNVAVPVDAAAVTTLLFAVVHQDAGKLGLYEYPGADLPVLVAGKLLSSSFQIGQVGQDPQGNKQTPKATSTNCNPCQKTKTPGPTDEPTVRATRTPKPTSTNCGCKTRTPTPTPTNTPTPTVSPTIRVETATPTNTPTPTVSPTSRVETPTPTNTPTTPPTTRIETATPTNTPTTPPTVRIETATPTNTPTASPTVRIVTATPTNTALPSPTVRIVTATPTNTALPSPTVRIVTATPTNTALPPPTVRIVTATPSPTVQVITATPSPTVQVITATPSPTVQATGVVIVVTNTPTPGAPAPSATALPPSTLPETGGEMLPWSFVLLIAGVMLLFNGVGFAAIRTIRMD